MESRNTEWVAERLAKTKPEWTANVDFARTRLRSSANLAPQRHRWMPALATVAAMLAIVVAVPQGRMLAQDLWYRWILRSFDVVKLDLSRIPLATSVSTDGNTAMVTLEEAERRVGYRPALPPGEAPTQMMVTGPMTVRQTVDVRALRLALTKAGASEVAVPEEWEGVTLRMDIGPLVIAGYPEEVQIIQSRPMEFQAPAAFPLAKFAETAFRCAGLSSWQARAMGEKFAANPAWLLDVPEDEVVDVQEIPLQSGTGVLVSEPVEGGVPRVTLLFSRTDRVFAVVSNSREQSIRIANELR